MVDGDLESKMKDKVLEGLIEHMHDKLGDDLSSKFSPKGMGVAVEAPSKERLIEGMDRAKAIMGKSDDDKGPDDEIAHGDENDEDKLMKMIEEDEDKEKGY